MNIMCQLPKNKKYFLICNKIWISISILIIYKITQTTKDSFNNRNINNSKEIISNRCIIISNSNFQNIKSNNNSSNNNNRFNKLNKWKSKMNNPKKINVF